MPRPLPPLLALVTLTALGCPESALPPQGLEDAGDEDGSSSVEVDAGVWTVDAGVHPAVPYQTGLEVELDVGQAIGFEEDGLRIFKGIPFAEPPVDTLRFRAPVPVEPWSGVLHAYAFGPDCWQEPLPTMSSRDNMSEDCLTLNIWAPNDDKVRPVMVWLFGGGFIVGGGDWSIYDGADLAKDGDVVVVTINYRLGLFGYLAHPALRDTDPEGMTGNAGLLDQLEALRWVRRNIRAFGGDPDLVTVFGESAGGMSVCGLLGAPRADGLFRRAIAQSSGGCNVFVYPEQRSALGIPPAFDTGAGLVDQLGCSDATDVVTCLQALPARQLADAMPLMSLFTGPVPERLRLAPTVDGVVLPELPLHRLQAGPLPAQVDVIIGSNKDEATLFTSFDVVLARSTLREQIVEAFGDEALADAVLDLYPASEFWLPKDAFNAFLGDVLFNCSPMAAARALGDRGRLYYWTRSPALISTFMGTMHAIDTIYVFNTFSAFALIPTAKDREVSEMVQAAWSSFAYTGTPEYPGGWPYYSLWEPSIARIDDDPELLLDIRGGRCHALRDLGLVP